MKWSASTKGLMIAVMLCIIAFAIYFIFLAKNDSYIVDNPTTNVYFFKINNGDEKVIAAGQSFPVDLKIGQNKMVVKDQQKKILYDSSFTVKKNRGLLNIAKQDYIINKQYYGYNIDRDSLVMALPKTKIDGNLYLGAPRFINHLYIEDFYFNVNEEYDLLIKNIQKIEYRTKIFRKEDFINYYYNYYQLKK